MLLAVIAILAWGQDNEFGTRSDGFLLAAQVMPEPELLPALTLLPVAGLTGIVPLLWQRP